MTTPRGNGSTRRRLRLSPISVVVQDRKPLDLAGLVNTLRYVTTAVQVLPFIYSALYIIALAVAFFAPEEIVRVFDSLFYVSPVVVATFLILSRVLRLCAWHRTACLMPALPRVVSFVDYYIVELSEDLAELNILVFGAMAVILLVAAYNIFFK